MVSRYSSIALPVPGQPISSGTFGINVRNAIFDLDARISSVDTSSNTGKVYSTANLNLTTTSEVAALTLTGMTFKAGLAYEATFRMGLVTAASSTMVNMRVRKYNATPSSGADWGEYFRSFGNGGVGSTGTPIGCIGTIFLINNTAADIVSDVNFTLAASVSGSPAATAFATTASPRYFTIKPTGFAADFVGLGVQVS
jgi:hypothetical protein